MDVKKNVVFAKSMFATIVQVDALVVETKSAKIV